MRALPSEVILLPTTITYNYIMLYRYVFRQHAMRKGTIKTATNY